MNVAIQLAGRGDLGGAILGLEEVLVEVADGLVELRQAGEELAALFDSEGIVVRGSRLGRSGGRSFSDRRGSGGRSGRCRCDLSLGEQLVNGLGELLRAGAGLGQHRRRARLPRGVNDAGHVGVREDDDGQALELRHRAHAVEDVQPVELGQHQVEQDDVGLEGEDSLQPRLPILCDLDVEALHRKLLRVDAANDAVVLDDEQSLHARWSGGVRA